MKVRFFSLLSILMILIIGSLIYFNSNQNKKTSEEDIFSEDLSTVPTGSPEVTIVPSQTLYPAYQLDGENTVYGYINSEGNFEITPSFDLAKDFYEGIATVSMSGRNYAIGTSGNIVFASEGVLNEFRNGAAVFSKPGNVIELFGYIDTKGAVIIEPQFIMASGFTKEDTAYVITDSKQICMIDKTGKILESLDYNPEDIYVLSLQDGYIVCLKNGNYSIMNIKGETLIENGENEIQYLGENRFAVREPGNDAYDAMFSAPYAIFDEKGKQLTDYKLYDISEYHGGYASASDSTSTFFIDTDGNEVSSLPKLDGWGKMELCGDIIKAEFDSDLFYTRKDGEVIWQANNTHILQDGIEAKEMKFRPNRYVLVKYPQIEGLPDASVQDQINFELERLFTENRAELKEEDMLWVDDTFSVNLMKDLLVVERDGYDYYAGAAHGMPLQDYYYFDIKTGSSYQLKDLFTEGSDYKAKLNELLTKEIASRSIADDSMIFPESFTGISDNQYFRLSEDTLTIYFYPYEIAAYAAGFQEFEFPFIDLDEFLNKSGDFWRSFH